MNNDYKFPIVKAQLKGEVVNKKKGNRKDGGQWWSVGLKQGNGTLYQFIENGGDGLFEKIEIGDIITINGEMWRDKELNYGYKFVKGMVVNLEKKQPNNDIPFA